MATPQPLTADRRQRYERAIEFAGGQVSRLVDKHPDYFPIYTVNGRWHHGGELWTDWTGGFLAGLLWRLWHATDEASFRQRAEHYSKLLEHRKDDREVHDLGFIFLNSYLFWYEATDDRQLQQVVIDAGRTLALRFRPAGGYLRSFVAEESLFIDIMMNVPIIFYAAQKASDEQLRQIAETHCRTTRDTIVRANGSTAHEGIFDTGTGEFLRESTHQGLSPQSAWARGLGWSLAGYTRVATMTGSDEFREVAERNAGYWLANLPNDRVPFWDFDVDLSDPLPWGPQKDSSAGAIAAGGLLRLARITPDAELAEAYRNTALAMLDALCEPTYLANEDPGWEGILKHGVYHTAKNLGVDESVMWGEFFFVDALVTALTEKDGLTENPTAKD